jgi:hypothetical protein
LSCVNGGVMSNRSVCKVFVFVYAKVIDIIKCSCFLIIFA